MARAKWVARCPPHETKQRQRENELRARDGRKPLPIADEDVEVELFEDLQGIWNAWQQLTHDRNGMGGGVPWTAASRWCEDHGIRGVERLRWCRLIQATDAAYMVAASKRR